MSRCSKDERSIALIVVLALALVLGLWFAMGWFASRQLDPGKFGDMFGAVNALFTGLAFAGVIVTVLLQSRELRLQRLELEQTRAELAGQKQQLELQTTAMVKQASDSHFFQLLDRFRELASSIALTGAASMHGPAYWQWFSGQITSNSLPQMTLPGTDLENRWHHIYGPREQELGPYFAVLGELLHFVAGADKESRSKWSRITRALLWPNEMAVIFYQGLASSGRVHLKGYIEEFGLLRFLPDDLPAVTPKQRSWYADMAFSDGEFGR